MTRSDLIAGTCLAVLGAGFIGLIGWAALRAISAACAGLETGLSILINL